MLPFICNFLNRQIYTGRKQICNFLGLGRKRATKEVIAKNCELLTLTLIENFTSIKKNPHHYPI
jgi:hypothetical protein